MAHGVAGVLFREIQGILEVLVVEEDRDDERTGKKKGMLSIPAGWINEGEEPEEAICREFLEESGREVQATGFLGEFPVRAFSALAFRVNLLSDEVQRTSEYLNPRWIPCEELLAMEVGKVRPIALDILWQALRTTQAETPAFQLMFPYSSHV
ncbi:MAG: NUDIX hydrolase [bacterium]|nr:NUDIX hydrolase [bacterium]